jgi:DNA-binding LacI/PurR family transcriptional regulator
VELGHREFAYIGPDSDLSRRRLAGLRAGLAAAGLTLPDDRVRTDPWAMAPASVARLLEALPGCRRDAAAADRFTALVTYNDHMAVGALRTLAAQGWRVPEEMSVSGFDGALPTDFRGARITTMAVPLEQLGAACMRVLSERMSAPDTPRRLVTLDVDFRAGDTTAALGEVAP